MKKFTAVLTFVFLTSCGGGFKTPQHNWGSVKVLESAEELPKGCEYMAAYKGAQESEEQAMILLRDAVAGEKGNYIVQNNMNTLGSVVTYYGEGYRCK